MPADERSRLNKDRGSYLNHLYARQHCIQRLFRRRKAAGRGGILKGQPGLALYRSDVAAIGIARSHNSHGLNATRIAEGNGDKDRGIKVNDGHRSSRSERMAPMAAEASPFAVATFQSARDGGLGPGRTSPAATSLSWGLDGIGIIFATSRLFLVIETERPVRCTAETISDARSFSSLIPTDRFCGYSWTHYMATLARLESCIELMPLARLVENFFILMK